MGETLDLFANLMAPAQTPPVRCRCYDVAPPRGLRVKCKLCGREALATKQAPLLAPPSMRGSARFSACGRYRYSLERWWGDETDPLVVCLLNPSKAGADPKDGDPTVARQIVRAKRLGAGGLIVVNAYAFVSTDPDGLKLSLAAGVDPVGPENDAAILGAARRSRRGVLCGWGQHATLLARGRAVATLLRGAGVELFALKVNADGSPQHPLYLPYSLRPLSYLA